MAKVRKLDFGWDRRARQAIAHGALTNSKRPESFVMGVYPTHLKSGNGCKVTDVNGYEYIDFIAGLGTNLLGYGNEEIASAIARQARRGITLSLGSTLEVELAEKVKGLFPFVEQVRFLKTGSDACSAAIRIARAYTGKNVISSQGYHGWHDDFVSLTPPAIGVPKRSWMEGTEVHGHNVDDIAAFITEPILTDNSKERIETLKYVRENCDEKKALLIFDEVITGFRYPGYCVANETGVIPDLICLGKAMGGGMPLACVGGKREVMESDYFVSSTFAGEAVSLAASMQFMDLLQGKFKIDYLWQKGQEFLDKFNAIWPEGVSLEGYPTRSKLCGEDKYKALFMQECAKAGILVGPSLFFTFPHIDVVDQVLSAFTDILNRIRLGEVDLEGEMPQKPYAARVRDL